MNSNQSQTQQKSEELPKGAVSQRGLTVITKIKPDQLSALKDLLNAIGNDISDNPHIDFSKLRSVHFMRWVVLDASNVRGEPTPPQLILSTNYDGPLKLHLEEMATQARDGFELIYKHCEGYPKNSDATAVVRYLTRHKKKNAAFYIGAHGRTVAQVEKEYELYQKVQGLLPREGRTASELATNLKSEIKNDPNFEWAKSKYKKPFLVKYGVASLAVGLLVILVLAGLGWALVWLPMLIATSALILLITVFWISLRTLEKKDAAEFKPSIQDIQQVSTLTQKEDYKVQNQITHLVEIKPGLTRRIAVIFVLWAINLLAKTLFCKGNLAGIVTIHFARWVVIDGGKRLLFFSNYDGNWESYLGEFVDRAAIGLTGVWSNTVGFPPTKNLVGKGARNSVEFKSWAREKQIETQVWYSARTSLSIKNVNNNTEIRKGIRKKMDKTEAKEWLSKL